MKRGAYTTFCGGGEEEDGDDDDDGEGRVDVSSACVIPSQAAVTMELTIESRSHASLPITMRTEVVRVLFSVGGMAVHCTMFGCMSEEGEGNGRKGRGKKEQGKNTRVDL